MKEKSGLSFKFGFVAAVFFAVFAAVFRTLHLFSVDFANEDFSGSKVFSFCFLGLIFVCFLFFLFCFGFGFKFNSDGIDFCDGFLESSGKLKISSVLAVVALFLHVFLHIFVCLITSVGKNSYYDDFYKFLIFISEFFLVGGLAYSFFDFKFKKGTYGRYFNFLYILPLLWAAIRLFMFCFSSFILFGTFQENQFYCLQIVSLAVFFLSFSKILQIKVDSFAFKSLIISGFVGFVLSFSNVFAKAIVTVMRNYGGNERFKVYWRYNVDIFNFGNFAVLDLVVSIFEMVFLCRFFRCLKSCKQTNKE